MIWLERNCLRREVPEGNASCRRCYSISGSKSRWSLVTDTRLETISNRLSAAKLLCQLLLRFNGCTQAPRPLNFAFDSDIHRRLTEMKRFFRSYHMLN